ncbi:MAG: GGDEF domain-containing protein [Candidatus Limnocylindrales bacterium]
MSADQIILLVVGLIVIAAVAVTVAYATSSAARGTGTEAGPRRPNHDPALGGLRGHEDTHEPPTGPATAAIRGSTTFISPASTRQVARVVALLFLAAVAVVVALTRAWPDQEPAIFTLLAAGTLLVVLFMDMVPPAAFGRYRRPLEGIGAIVFLGLLMLLTGGAGSPFLVGFYLVAAGTALSSEGRAPLAVALVGAGTIAIVGLLDGIVGGPLEPEALAWVGINAVSLILLADIATAAARSQRHARDEALRASRFDALTGLYNRGFFFTTMQQEIRRSDRMGRGFTLLMLDLDDLKPVNDTFGHQWGDRLLKAIADTIRQTVRFTDAAARYGGDEFVVLLPETDAAGGYVVGEKLRRDIHALTLRAGDRNVRSSVSVGLVAYPDDGSTIEQLVAAADVAMYEAKRRGKNRIVGYQMRTERVATDIDAGSHTLVQLTPAESVRTGGDPAPWGSAPRGPSPESVSGRRYERSTIPVEPDEDAPAPWSTGVTQPAQARPPARDPEWPVPEPPHEEPPEPPTRTRTAVEAPDEPWLTRTDGAPDAGGNDDDGFVRPGRDSTRRPADEYRLPGTGPSRSDEIRGDGDERPWIALPIEPDEDEDDRPG